ncbi:MAG: hypothetical protein HXS50_04860, partial [Theionarchaea archaeon]|nr:hypothetical protein [Theionarchaea archaeon]
CYNPQPRFYAHVHNQTAKDTDGFSTYSDGAHDDVNKVVWSRRGWDPEADVDQIVLEYCRFFFGPTSLMRLRRASSPSRRTGWAPSPRTKLSTGRWNTGNPSRRRIRISPETGAGSSAS